MKFLQIVKKFKQGKHLKKIITCLFENEIKSNGYTKEYVRRLIYSLVILVVGSQWINSENTTQRLFNVGLRLRHWASIYPTFLKCFMSCQYILVITGHSMVVPELYCLQWPVSGFYQALPVMSVLTYILRCVLVSALCCDVCKHINILEKKRKITLCTDETHEVCHFT